MTITMTMTMRTKMRPIVCLVSALALLLTHGCSGGGGPETKTGGEAAKEPPKKAGAQSRPAASGGQRMRITGDVGLESLKRKRMRIWGSVQRIIEKKHGKLPQLETVSKGGIGDPVTEIINDTPYKLTLWFAGKCAHQTEVPKRGRITAVFCPGTYHLAAMVANKEYLPLVREHQTFKGGMGYKLSIIIKQRPTTTPK